MNSVPRWIPAIAGCLGLLGVILGAFGAHYLKETLTVREMLPVWQTAVLYHLIHAVALLAVGSWIGNGRQVAVIAICWISGVILFSGSLYWLALGGPKLLGPVTPIGGMGFLVGWAGVVWSALKSPRP
jgi:uncharacterized membrane protein YgdD (TMEM256/DUF423 family)